MMPHLSLKVWLRIGTAALFALLLAGFLIRGEALGDCKLAREREIAEHAVTKRSVEALEAELKRVMAEQVALSTSDAARIAASRQTLEITRAAEKYRQSLIDRLEQSAAQPVAHEGVIEACEASEAVKAVWQ